MKNKGDSVNEADVERDMDACVCVPFVPLARGKESKKRKRTVWKRPTTSRRGGMERKRKRDLLIAHIPSLFLPLSSVTLSCISHCVHVYTYVCVYYLQPTRSHINYNQIGYWSHTRSQYWFGVCSLAKGHETLSPIWSHRETESHFSQSLAHAVQMTIFTASKVCYKCVTPTSTMCWGNWCGTLIHLC